MTDARIADERMMISFLEGQRRFNYRVAGVVIRDGHVLVCREDDDDYVMLPGGRVEMGETSTVALAREIEEELQCVGEIGRLLFTCEGFFSRSGEEFHEIGMFYEVKLPDDFPFETGISSLVTFDEGHELTFDWVWAEEGVLGQLNLKPAWLCGRLADLPDTPDHLIADER